MAAQRRFGETLRLADLVTDSNAVISDTSFEECTLLGPAILWFAKGVEIINNSWSGAGAVSSVDDYLIVVQPGSSVMGAIAVENSRFLKCQFRVCGILVDPVTAERWRSDVGIGRN